MVLIKQLVLAFRPVGETEEGVEEKGPDFEQSIGALAYGGSKINEGLWESFRVEQRHTTPPLERPTKLPRVPFVLDADDHEPQTAPHA